MNPKTVNDLDPKLKETYERVMGTSFTPAAAPAAQSRPVQTTVVEQPVVEPAAQVPVQPLPPLPQQLASNPMQEMVQSPQMTKMPPFQVTAVPPASVMIQNATTTKKKSFLKPALLIIGGIIFFIAYGVIWAKVFGLF
jgi:hypothetical protein